MLATLIFELRNGTEQLLKYGINSCSVNCYLYGEKLVGSVAEPKLFIFGSGSDLFFILASSKLTAENVY